MVKNMSENIKVPASFLVDGFQDLSSDTKDAIVLFSRKQSQAVAENRALDASESEELANLLPTKMRIDLANIGAVLPSDQIELTMRLGDFLYHVYAFNSKPVQAPLAIKRHEKKLLELAETLDNNEFDVPAEVLDVVEDVLLDAKKWEATQFGAVLMVNGCQKYIGLSSLGASIFRKVVDSVTSICTENNK